MNASDLLELAVRCEAAGGPDRELDALIDAATAKGRWAPHLNVQPSPTKGRVQYRSKGDSTKPWWEREAKRFTASLDAAMKLVPEGWEWGVTSHAAPCRAFAAAEPDSGWRWHKATTPALALCAAALRARAASGIEARSDATGTGAAEGESPAPKGDAQ